MNMSLMNNIDTNQNLGSNSEANKVAALTQGVVEESTPSAKAKQFLDRHFPLSQGSHQEVISYLVYYTHLIAFMADGSQSGLKRPRQFVALSGHKSDPSCLVLKDGKTHLAINIDRQGLLGCQDQAGVNDVLLQAMPHKQLTQEWTSLLNQDMLTRPLNVTAKDGSDYCL
ncbi:malate synthase [Shewanella sp. SR44-3]|uniref:malate synthase n=1 Tax=unclassified Shewanella TaxID=196818 RepID=UPI0015F8D617|nr:malate synthase [Shewanella sp. SR44-3]MBB1268442.1 malate synthase [Shewanella sp. SR44-3]